MLRADHEVVYNIALWFIRENEDSLFTFYASQYRLRNPPLPTIFISAGWITKSTALLTNLSYIAKQGANSGKSSRKSLRSEGQRKALRLLYRADWTCCGRRRLQMSWRTRWTGNAYKTFGQTSGLRERRIKPHLNEVLKTHSRLAKSRDTGLPAMAAFASSRALRDMSSRSSTRIPWRLTSWLPTKRTRSSRL